MSPDNLPEQDPESEAELPEADPNLSGKNPADSRGAGGTAFTGTEPIFGSFTNTANILANTRLTHEGSIFVVVNDLAPTITNLGRDYRAHGNAIRTLQELQRLRGIFDTRVQQWRQREAARLSTKAQCSGMAIREMEKEFSRVNLEINRADSVLNRIVNDLDLITRTGADCPLLYPQNKVRTPKRETAKKAVNKKKTIDPTLVSLSAFFKTPGLELRFADARFPDDFDDTLREDLIDRNNLLTVMVHWTNRNPNTRDRGNLHLRIWLVPKRVDALIQLEKLLPHFRFHIQYENGDRRPVTWNKTTTDREDILEHPKLLQFLRDVSAAGFEDKKNLVRRKFEFYMLDFATELPFDVGIKRCFRIVIEKKPQTGNSK